MKNLFYLFLLVSFVGCRWIAKTKFHTGRHFEFKNKKSYVHYLDNNNAISSFEHLYVDSLSYVKFLNAISGPSASLVYQGCYLNDSVVVKTSNAFNQKKYCPGAIYTEIKTRLNTKGDMDSLQLASLNLSRYSFRHIDDGHIFSLDRSVKKLKIILTYSYAFGTYYDQLFAEIKAIQQKNKKQVDVFLVCIDPVYQLR